MIFLLSNNFESLDSFSNWLFAAPAITEHFIFLIVSGLTTVPSTTYFVSQEPNYTHGDSAYDPPETKTVGFSTSPVFTGVFGVDRLEVSIASGTKYEVAHQGWVGLTTYIDMHGNLRVKSEVLVAGGILTTSDAPDDGPFPDS